jgi:hypothetical protein
MLHCNVEHIFLISGGSELTWNICRKPAAIDNFAICGHDSPLNGDFDAQNIVLCLHLSTLLNLRGNATGRLSLLNQAALRFVAAVSCLTHSGLSRDDRLCQSCFLPPTHDGVRPEGLNGVNVGGSDSLWTTACRPEQNRYTSAVSGDGSRIISLSGRAFRTIVVRHAAVNSFINATC